jgi:hypothetical protein
MRPVASLAERRQARIKYALTLTYRRCTTLVRVVKTWSAATLQLLRFAPCERKRSFAHNATTCTEILHQLTVGHGNAIGLVLIPILSMVIGYETARPVEVDIDGVKCAGTYRVMAGSVIVYWRNEVKFAPYGTTPPERFAQWLLTDVYRRVNTTKRRSSAA